MLLIGVLFSLTTNASGKDKTYVSFGAGSNFNFSTEISFLHQFASWIGLGGSLGYYHQWHCDYYPSGDSYTKGSTSWELSDDDLKISNSYLEPFVSLSSPALLSWNNGRLNVETEMGLALQVPYKSINIKYTNSYSQKSEYKSYSCNKGQWVIGDLRVSVNVNFSSFIMSLEYSLSNLDIYSTYRNFNIDGRSIGDFYPKKKITHTVFVKLGCIL